MMVDDDEQIFTLGGEMQVVWGTATLDKAMVAHIIRDTELQQTTRPLTFLKYLL